MAEPLRFVTSCYGEAFWSAVPRWARHLVELDPVRIDIIALDDTACHVPVPGVTVLDRVMPTRILVAGCMNAPRLTHIIHLLEQQTIAVQIDVDIRLKRSIAPLVALPFDLIFSRAFNFPKRTATRLGFVACAGFYIAKPTSLPFCRRLLGRIEGQTQRPQNSDQYYTNMMILYASEHGHHSVLPVDVDGRRMDIDVFRVAGCTVCVLPADVITREQGIDAGVYGDHGHAMLRSFVGEGVGG